MPEYVADTHALFWYLAAMPQLGAKALAAFRAGERGRARILVPSIVLAELYYVNVKLGAILSFTHAYSRMANAAQFEFVDFQAQDVLQFDHLTAVPEMHDRMIAGVALARNCPCLTRDPVIIQSGLVQIVWA